MSHDDLKKLPEVANYIPKILVALRAMDGVAKSTAVRDSIVASMIANKEPINETVLKTGTTKYQNDIRWARMYLLNAKMLEPVEASGYGVWKLSDAGWTTSLDPDTITKIYNHTAQKGKKATFDVQIAPTDKDAQQDLPGLNSWELQLQKILKTMPDKGFERLCAAIMTANGLHSTKVTGQSGDKGIDGEGILPFDPLALVTVKVAWQCKRFETGKVSSQAIRDFRGALASDIKHGILFTTSSFTADAQEESRDLGKTPIKLVDLERLIELLQTLQLGVKPVTTHAVDQKFFEPYLKPVGASSGPHSLFSMTKAISK